MKILKSISLFFNLIILSNPVLAVDSNDLRVPFDIHCDASVTSLNKYIQTQNNVKDVSGIGTVLFDSNTSQATSSGSMASETRGFNGVIQFSTNYCVTIQYNQK